MQTGQNQKTRVIVMLGARFCIQNGDPSFAPLFPLLNKSDRNKSGIEVSGGDSRMRAICLLYEKFQKETVSSQTEAFRIITTGGIEKIEMPNGKIIELSRADEAAKKLHAEHHIPQNIIESLPSRGSTFGNGEAVAKWLARHEDISEIEIVTNRSHMLRAWIMFVSVLYEKQFGTSLHFSKKIIASTEKILKETLGLGNRGDTMALTKVRNLFSPLLRDMHVSIEPIIVEDILLASNDFDRRYANMIDNNPFTQKARQSNRQGISAFLRGTYQTK